MLILCGFWRCTDDVFPLSEFHLFLGEQESTPVRSNLSCPMSKPKGQNLSQSNSLKTTFIYKDHFQSISIQLLLLFLNSFFFLSLFSHAFVFFKKNQELKQLVLRIEQIKRFFFCLLYEIKSFIGCKLWGNLHESYHMFSL